MMRLRARVSEPGSDLSPVIPSFRQAFLFWLKLGFISFGGPAGQIAIMQTELVDRRRWISQSRFLHALNYWIACRVEKRSSSASTSAGSCIALPEVS